MIVRPLPLGFAAIVLVAPALAQSGDSSGQPGSQAIGQAGPPPDRVGRFAAVTGAVSFHLAGATEWQVASRNLPVTSGTAVWVPPSALGSAEASLGVSGNSIVLGPSTELEVDRLDDQVLASTQPQGQSYWHLRTVAVADTYSLHTPRGTVTIATAGRYEIVSGDTEHPTTITVLDGAATLTDVPTTQQVGPGHMLTITGDGAVTSFTASIGPVVEDGFLRHVLAEEAPPRPRAPAVSAGQTAPAIIAEMTGSDALYDVGQWTENADYGPVWYPPVADYVPYRQGRWAYVAPWGWTWVDDAPWGFAPSHYGRWAQFQGRWGWVPGRDWAPGRPPVYAPALVGFIGGAALGAGLGFAHGPLVGWAPLGPHEGYRPPYRVNDRKIQILNQPTGATIEVNRPVIINQSAVTIVPAQVLTSSAPVAGAFRPGSAATIATASVLQERPQAVPTRATIGATRAVLQQVNPMGLTAPTTHVGPGPTLAGPVVVSPTLVSPGFVSPGFASPGFEAPRPTTPPILGAAPLPQIGPAAILGGAAIGAVAGGLLRGPARPDALPTLRQRGDVPPGVRAATPGEPGAIARPRPPIRPNLLDPTAPTARRGEDLLARPPAVYQPPVLRQPMISRPAPVSTPIRPDLPRVPASEPAFRERPPEGRDVAPPGARPEFLHQAAPLPRQQQPASPQPELQRPPAFVRPPAPIQLQREAPQAMPPPPRPQQNVLPRRPEQQQRSEPRPEQRPEPRPERRMGR